MRIRIFVLILISILPAACQTVGVSKASLRPIQTPAYAIELGDDFSFEASPKFGSLVITLSKGEYLPIGRDDHGIYYVGPGKCASYSNNSEKKDIFRVGCGIYIEDAKPDGWREFEYATEEDLRRDDSSDMVVEYGAVGALTSAAMHGLFKRYARKNLDLRKKVFPINVLSRKP